MQRTLRNLAAALVAGTFAFAAGAQVEQAPKSRPPVPDDGVTVPRRASTR